MVAWSIGDDAQHRRCGSASRSVAALIIVGAVVFSKRKGIAMSDSDADGSTGAGSADQPPGDGQRLTVNGTRGPRST